MSAVEEVVTEAPAVEAVPKRAMTLGLGTSLVVLAALVIAPLFVKNFIIFQMTMLLIYALAVLALNILTGGSGQFSLGQSAFYAVGAYTSAILMEHAGMNYALTLPIAQIALHFGANDVQGTIVREQIFRAAGSTTGTEQKTEELVRTVLAAGRVPVQRDTLYNEVRRWDAEEA